jgi:vacuolar-type H+-ATPase subunit F/Vma7
MNTKTSSIWKAYGYAWVTLGFFLVSLVGHWLFGWFAFVNEQQAHAQPIVVSDYLMEMMRDTLENWQSEFLQLLWQVGGLAILLYVGSPQSKEGDDRMEAKIDQILRRLDPQNAERIIQTLDEDYSGRHTDARHAHR